jgi:hypothetical protein
VCSSDLKDRSVIVQMPRSGRESSLRLRDFSLLSTLGIFIAGHDVKNPIRLPG